MFNFQQIKKLIIISIIFGFLLPSFNFTYASEAKMKKTLFSSSSSPLLCRGSMHQDERSLSPILTVKTPETIEEAKKINQETAEALKKEMPGILERLWKERVIPVWEGMWRWFESKTTAFWQKIQELFGKEVEKRKPIIEEELIKEKQEIKKELPEIGKSSWERFRELLY